MEVTLFLFAVGYLAVIIVGASAAFKWARRRKLGFFKGTGVVLATLFVIYAVPFGDHTLGEIKKHQLCKELGGEKIFEVVENVEGFMWEKSGGPGKPYTTHGYQFHEASNLSGEIFRYTKSADGAVDRHKVESSLARYTAQRFPYENLGKHHAISRFVITDIRDNKVLATNGTVAFRGGWLGLVGSKVCPNEPFNSVLFVQSVLKPGKSKE